MDKSALELFLAESTAVAVIGEFDALGSMASALNKRHKIRHTDLTTILGLAAAQRADTYERAILVFNLILLGGGAYDNPQSIISAGDLRSLKIQPHWASSNAHNFSSVCLWEPMNLWAGWANENQSNNNEIIDAHMLKYFSQTPLIFTDMNAQKVNTTPNMTIAKTLLPGTTAKTELSVQTQKSLQRRPSSHSLMLLQSRGHIERSVSDFHAYAKPGADGDLTRQQLKNFLFNAGVLERRSTAAGDKHYVELLGSLKTRNMATLQVYATIERAQQQWNIYRAQLRTLIAEWQDDLNQSTKQSGIFHHIQPTSSNTKKRKANGTP